MNRKIWAAISLVFIFTVRVHQHMNGTALHLGMVLEAVVIVGAAFVLPVAPIVWVIERYVYHLDPWADTNNITLPVLTLTASAFWFIPWSRLEVYAARWFASFIASRQFRPLRARSVADAALAYEEKGGTK